MSSSDERKTREQRLAAKLRENLKRRKGQARARGEGRDKPAGGGGSAPDPGRSGAS
jgi:hypothetical protein